MPVSSWAGTYRAWRWVAGEGVGDSLATFWDLQVESYLGVLVLALVLDLVYGLHQHRGRWKFSPRGGRARATAYASLGLLALVCSTRASTQAILQAVVPDDMAVSLARYLRRALEGVLTAIAVLVFLDLVRPAGLEPAGPSPHRRVGRARTEGRR